ncbi:hypothetical protein P9239_20255 [Caballeronia sp. LZ062]|uniref:hypothetical protein n=1 Tax=unclassified Caballeronia TaxID=2646786 RepID=UPI00285E6E9D|nr:MULTISPECIES: hypothetical protein [unclassified Caballeronia]MDR5856009.1 hypothetical protein [Caballeronia sp. LZ050]MDR5872679.1 hypothetical protein [Caballeronia sp. LZ062]
MRSHLIHGAARSALDTQILDFVSKNAACLLEPRVGMCVGIKNEAGELYRIILADGIIEMIRVDKFLLSIDCVEEFTDEFDAMFRVPRFREQADVFNETPA